MGRGMAEAIGRSANTIAGYMGQSAQDDLNLRQKQADRLEQIRLTAELRDPKTGSGPAPMSEQQMDEEAAGRMGTSVSDVQRTRNAVKTGDTSAFREKKSGKVEGPDGKVHDWETNDYPPGFEEQFSTKVKALYSIREQLRLGKDYKEVAEGRNVQQKTDQVAGMVAGEMDPVKVGKAQAAAEGEGSIGGTGDTVYDKFDGTVTTTPVGNARIDNLKRPDPSERTSQRAALTQERIAADNEASRLLDEKTKAIAATRGNKRKMEEVSAAFAQREKDNAAKRADIERRLRAVDGDEAPAAPTAPTSSGGFEGFKIRKIR